MGSGDPLLSVSQVARMWGTGHDIVVDLVSSSTLPTLDRGELIARGHFDVPLIRQSWAKFLDLAGASDHRIIEPPEGESVHPALHAALNVHSALDRGDAEELICLSSKASRKNRDPMTLYTRWIELTEGGFPSTSGIGSTIYTLEPMSAVAARVIADAPKVPRAVEGRTPAQLLAILPFVEEEGEWKVDLPMFEGPAFLPDVLVSPLPNKPDVANDEKSTQEDGA